MDAVKQKIKEFVVDNFLFGDGGQLQDQTSFLDEGIIDSMGILELIDFIDKEFNVAVADEELLPENLDSINNIVSFIGGKLNPDSPCFA